MLTHRRRLYSHALAERKTAYTERGETVLARLGRSPSMWYERPGLPRRSEPREPCSDSGRAQQLPGLAGNDLLRWLDPRSPLLGTSGVEAEPATACGTGVILAVVLHVRLLMAL